MLREVKDTDAAHWEELARREPYFPVLTHEGFSEVGSNRVATAAFFETGEADISSLLQAMASLLGREIRPSLTLDFGCGVGRLTLPLARRSAAVIACDIAPTMLAHARQNLEGARLENVRFMLTDELTRDLTRDLTRELTGRSARDFDFVCALLVFQHIPPPDGYALIRTMLNLLAPGGVAALHVMIEPSGRRLLRFARFVRARSRHPLNRGAQPPRRQPPFTRMHEYDETVLIRDIDAAGTRLAGRLTTQHGDSTGVVLIVERPATQPETV